MSEPRWIGQRDEYACGAIVVCNVLKWAEVDLGSSWARDGDFLKELCSVTYDNGTHENDMEWALRTIGGEDLVIQRRKRWKLAKIIDHVESRGCVIFDYTPPTPNNMAKAPLDREAHYAVCVDIMGEGANMWFKMVNITRGETISWIPRRYFRWLFCHRRWDDRMWLVRLRD